MADDGHTINVGPVEVGKIVTRGESSTGSEGAAAAPDRPAPSGDPIDTDAIRANAANAKMADDVGATATHGAVPTIEPMDVLALCDEVDRLRAAIAAIPRHRPGSAPRGAWLGQWTGMCGNCRIAWPCPTEQAHRLLEADRG